MSTFEDLANELELTLCAISNFKIGKTDQNITDCYTKKHADNYSHYKIITYSKKLEAIESFEQYLLARFQSLKACDNKDLEDRRLADAERYVLYLVYNE